MGLATKPDGPKFKVELQRLQTTNRIILLFSIQSCWFYLSHNHSKCRVTNRRIRLSQGPNSLASPDFILRFWNAAQTIKIGEARSCWAIDHPGCRNMLSLLPLVPYYVKKAVFVQKGKERPVSQFKFISPIWCMLETLCLCRIPKTNGF